MTPILAGLPYSRRHTVGCACERCPSQGFGADIPPAGAPAGPWASVVIPPVDRAEAVRSQAAEVFRRAVWEAAGAEGWDTDATAAWSRIGSIPALPSVDAQPGHVVKPVESWFRRALAEVPESWRATDDPRAGLAQGALSSYAAQVLAQLDGMNPVGLYNVGFSWRSQALADKAAGLYNAARQGAGSAAAAARETLENMAPGLGFGGVLAFGILATAGAVFLFPEAAAAGAQRAARGLRGSTSKSRS